MKNLFFLMAASLILMLSACANVRFSGSFDRIEPSGNMVTEQREVVAFNELKLQTSYDVVIHQGDETSLSVTADENVIHHVITDVNDGVLFINIDKSHSAESPKVEITVSDLSRIEIIGASNVAFPEDFDFDSFQIQISGSGNINLKGHANDFDVAISGSGNIRAENLISQNVRVSISGSGRVDVYADKKLDANISGSGNINYYGNAQDIHQSISGSGRISHK